MRRPGPTDYIPSVEERTGGASPRGQVALTITAAFVISTLGKIDPKSKPHARDLMVAAAASNVWGWLVLVVILAIMSDFYSSQPLATAFGWLILLAAVLARGPQALDNLQALMDSKKGTA